MSRHISSSGRVVVARRSRRAGVLGFVLALWACAAVLCDDAWARAEARVDTGYSEGQSGGGDSDFGEFSANADHSSTFEGASASGHARVDARVADDSVSRVISLAARATGTGAMPPESTTRIGAHATASAFWTDSLGYKDPGLATDEFLGLSPYIYFPKRITGSITNANAAQFGIGIFRDGSTPIEEHREYAGPGVFNELVVLRIPANALLPIVDPVTG
jgi:hypothetical protein